MTLPHRDECESPDAISEMPPPPSFSTRFQFRCMAFPRWLLVVAIVGAMLSAADQRGRLFVTPHDDLAVYHMREVNVIAVVSGHTLKIDLADALNEGRLTHVRLWGLTAPYGARPGRAAQPLADEAHAFTTLHTLGRPVILHLEPHRPRDSFGRVLAHVALPNGSLLNEEILQTGLAETDDRWHHRHLRRYARAERAARRHERGLWDPSLQN